jgi:FtsZ-binding cell division protein ZapB
MDIALILSEYYKGQEWTIHGNTYEALIWYDEKNSLPKPTLEELTAKQEELMAVQPLKDLRQERNRRLAEVDWIFTSDYDLSVSDHAAWMAYRKALRDLPSTTEDPANPVWPEKPPLPKGETFTKNVTGEIVQNITLIEALQHEVTELEQENRQLRTKVTNLERKSTDLELGLIELRRRVGA